MLHGPGDGMGMGTMASFMYRIQYDEQATEVQGCADIV
jgi:hypothetical protein